MNRHHDLAQPFSLIHPIACECETCSPTESEPSITRSIGSSVIIGLGGVLLGQFLGWALNVTGILAAVGIG